MSASNSASVSVFMVRVLAANTVAAAANTNDNASTSQRQRTHQATRRENNELSMRDNAPNIRRRRTSRYPNGDPGDYQRGGNARPPTNARWQSHPKWRG